MEFNFRFLVLLLAGLLAWQHLGAQAPSAVEIRSMPNDTHKVKALSRLTSRTLQENPDSAKAYADSTLALALRLNYEKGQALGYEKTAMVLFHQGRMHEALRNYEKALDYHKRVGNMRSASIILNGMGLVARSQGEFDKAMAYYFEALELNENLGNIRNEATTLKSIGETYAIQGNYEKAEEFFGRALEGFRAAGDTAMEYTMILNLGGFYMEKGEHGKSLPLVQEAKKYFHEHGPKNEQGRSEYILGRIYLETGELNKSEDAYQRSLAIYQEIGFVKQQIGCLIKLGAVAQKRGNTERAVELVTEALAAARAIGTKAQVSLALLQLSQIYEEGEDYKRAFEYRVKHESMEDSISTEEARKTIAELQEKYQSELNERQLAELSAQNAVNELKVKKQRNQQNALIGMVFLALIVVGLLFNQYRGKKKTSDLLMEKNILVQSSLEEKEVLLKEIHHRVKNNLQFISSLLNLQARHVTDPGTLKVLKEGKHRVNSMSLVHQKLYQEKNLKGVEMSSYIANLLDSLIHSYEIDRTKVAVETHLDEIYLDIDTAIPLGLVLNELITNVLKYAFEGRENGKIAIVFREEQDHLLLSVSDDGVGLPEGFSFEKNDQFGFELVQSLATKLKATIDIKNDKGTSITLHIHKFNKA